MVTAITDFTRPWAPPGLAKLGLRNDLRGPVFAVVVTVPTAALCFALFAIATMFEGIADTLTFKLGVFLALAGLPLAFWFLLRRRMQPQSPTLTAVKVDPSSFCTTGDPHGGKVELRGPPVQSFCSGEDCAASTFAVRNRSGSLFLRTVVSAPMSIVPSEGEPILVEGAVWLDVNAETRVDDAFADRVLADHRVAKLRRASSRAFEAVIRPGDEVELVGTPAPEVVAGTEGYRDAATVLKLRGTAGQVIWFRKV